MIILLREKYFIQNIVKSKKSKKSIQIIIRIIQNIDIKIMKNYILLI